MFAKRLKNTSFKAVVIFMMITILLPVVLPQKANAVTASDWRAGRIIDDAVFYNKNSMTAQQIQQFLDAKVPNCDRNRASSNPSYQPPWTCLKEYQENTATKENNIGRFNANGTPYSVPGGKLAGQIIWEVAQEYGINPQVLIVMLQKEQGLITDNWPWKVQYQKAMGYACPDTAPCDTQYYGFYNQVSSAAWQLKRYIALPYRYNFQSGVSRYIQYSPNAACGGSQVYLENAATAALYNYTPYQPNAGALTNMYGTADCGAYGNRNFWRYFNDWFGSTLGMGGFVSLDIPRWMQIKNTGVTKIHVYTGESAGGTLEKEQQIRFIDKIFVDGVWYLRTEFNHNDGGLYGIPANQLEEIPYKAITPKWVTFNSDGNRSLPAARTSVGDLLVKGTSVKVVEQISINGNIYYRTEFNKNNNQNVGIHSRFVKDFEPISLEGPRNMCTQTDINRLDPTNGTLMEKRSDGIFAINKKTLINGEWYLQTDADSGTNIFYKKSDIGDRCYVPLQGPRKMKITQDIQRFDPFSGYVYDTIRRDTIVPISTKIYKNGAWYFRTEYNTNNNQDAVIPSNLLTDDY